MAEPRERDCLGTSAMASKQHVLGLVDAGREIRRPPLVGMQFLHEGAVGAGNLVGARSGLKAKDLISLLFRHFSGGRATAPPPPPPPPFLGPPPPRGPPGPKK